MYTIAQRKVVAAVSVPASIRSRVQTSRVSRLKPACGSSFFYQCVYSKKKNKNNIYHFLMVLQQGYAIGGSLYFVIHRWSMVAYFVSYKCNHFLLSQLKIERVVTPVSFNTAHRNSSM